jgi:CRISPR/Cas system-associated endonuclease Cas1
MIYTDTILSYAYTILYADIFRRVWDRIVTG